MLKKAQMLMREMAWAGRLCCHEWLRREARGPRSSCREVFTCCEGISMSIDDAINMQSERIGDGSEQRILTIWPESCGAYA